MAIRHEIIGSFNTDSVVTILKMLLSTADAHMEEEKLWSNLFDEDFCGALGSSSRHNRSAVYVQHPHISSCNLSSFRQLSIPNFPEIIPPV